MDIMKTIKLMFIFDIKKINKHIDMQDIRENDKMIFIINK